MLILGAPCKIMSCRPELELIPSTPALLRLVRRMISGTVVGVFAALCRPCWADFRYCH